MSRFNLNNNYKAVVIGGSAGSFQGIVKILSQLPKTFPLVEPFDKEQIKKGGVYLAPSNYHMSIELGNYFAMSTEEMINNSRPAIDITLGTAAYVLRDTLI